MSLKTPDAWCQSLTLGPGFVHRGGRGYQCLLKQPKCFLHEPAWRTSNPRPGPPHSQGWEGPSCHSLAQGACLGFRGSAPHQPPSANPPPSYPPSPLHCQQDLTACWLAPRPILTHFPAQTHCPFTWAMPGPGQLPVPWTAGVRGRELGPCSPWPLDRAQPAIFPGWARLGCRSSWWPG